MLEGLYSAASGMEAQQSQFEGFNTTGAFAACVVLALIALTTVVAMRMFRPKEEAG